jgi:hypothetical protein
LRVNAVERQSHRCRHHALRVFVPHLDRDGTGDALGQQVAPNAGGGFGGLSLGGVEVGDCAD